MEHKEKWVLGKNLNKLENPVRIAELSPEKTLKRIGLDEKDVVVDIGAGSGIFTISAAKMTVNSVYAFDINSEFLEIIDEKARKEGLDNVVAMKVSDTGYNLKENIADLVLMSTVLHEIADKATLLDEIKRIMKDTGKLAIIEFHKRETTMGPPVAHRLSKDEVATICGKHGFKASDEFDLGDNYYCIVFEQKQ